MPTLHDDADRELAPIVGISGTGAGGTGADMSATGSATQPYLITQRGVGAAFTSEPMPSVYIARRAGQNQTDEINDALNESADRKVFLGPGRFIVDPDSLICTQNQVGIEGQGNFFTKLDVTGGGTALTFNNGVTDMVRNYVRNLGFLSPDTSSNKIAINVVGGTQFEMQSVTIGVGGTWTGANSIGLQISGHEFGWINNFASYADRPILVQQNPYDIRDLDHFDFNNCYLLANGNPCFEVVDGCNLTSNRLTGHAWINGTHGFRFNDTTTTGFGGFLSISDVRWEQATGGTGYTVYFSHNHGFRELNLTRIWSGTGTTVKGYFLRKTHMTYINSCQYGGTLEALNVDGAGMDLLKLNNVFFFPGSTRSMVGMSQTRGDGDPLDNSEPNYNGETWVSDTNTNIAKANFFRNLHTSGNVGLGGVPSTTAGEYLLARDDADAFTFLTSHNANAVATGAVGGVRAKNDLSALSMLAHGSARVVTRFGVTLGGWLELLGDIAGSFGMIVGTRSQHDLLVGTNSVVGLKFDGINQHPSFPVSHKRVTSQFNTTSTTLANVTGLTFNVTAGKIYEFRADLSTTSDVAGGVKFAIAGTATATSIIYKAKVWNAGTATAIGTARATALATAVGDVTAVTVADAVITGSIVVNAAGTLTVQFAANAATGTSSVLVGSTFEIREVAA